MTIKYKTNNAEQRENNTIVISFGYCDIQNLERYMSANAYTCGTYGWNADFYNFEGWTISTGYRPLDYIFEGMYSNKKEKEFVYNYMKKEILKLEKHFKENNDYKLDEGRKLVHKKLDNLYFEATKKYRDSIKG